MSWLGSPASILMIQADQFTADVLGCYGGPVPTPNIDRLADGGVLFSEAICAIPFCSPSRASILTGRYLDGHGIVYNVSRYEYAAESTLPTEEGIKKDDITTEKLLNEGRYATHHNGKFHLTEDPLSYFPDMYDEGHEYARDLASTFTRPESGREMHRRTGAGPGRFPRPRPVPFLFATSFRSIANAAQQL